MLGFDMEWRLGGLGILRADLMFAVRLLLALGVTCHVLLRKREIGSAIGWIGLAWITPVIGAIAYFMLGINRVRRLARRLRGQTARRRGEGARWAVARTDHLAPLEVAAARITARPLETGNAVVLLRDGDAAYPPMVAAIAAARSSVALCSYILRDDAGGAPFLDALIAAHRRGVAVRVLVDGIGSGYFHSAAFARLTASGVPAARFMHSTLPWKMPFLNLRTHKKILVVDGRHGFTGGMNIGAENLLAFDPAHPVRDTHFAVEGPVVAQLVDAFARDWQFATREELEGEAWFPPLAPAGAAAARVATSGPDHDIEKIEFLVIEAIACARRSIRIATPYFLPDERLVTELATASLRGIPVDIVIPERSNHVFVDWATRAHVAPLLDAGVRLWLSPAPFDHSKMMVVDGVWSLIGSSNWDMRSFRLNFELGVEVYDETLAETLSREIAARQGRRLLAPELMGRSLPVQLRDAAMRLMLPYL